MSVTVFVDTNVLLYARDLTDAQKQRRAAAWMAALWESRMGRLSYQVLQEYYVTATRRLDPPRAKEDARADVASLVSWRPDPVDLRMIDGAWAVQDRFGFAWWDSVIIAAALRAGCDHLLTEDPQDGQEIDGLTDHQSLHVGAACRG